MSGTTLFMQDSQHSWTDTVLWRERHTLDRYLQVRQVWPKKKGRVLWEHGAGILDLVQRVPRRLPEEAMFKLSSEEWVGVSPEKEEYFILVPATISPRFSPRAAHHHSVWNSPSYCENFLGVSECFFFFFLESWVLPEAPGFPVGLFLLFGGSDPSTSSLLLLPRHWSNMTLKGHGEIILSYFQVLDNFFFIITFIRYFSPMSTRINSWYMLYRCYYYFWKTLKVHCM